MYEFTITGRIVQGDVNKAQPPSKDPVTKQVKIDPATGQPRPGQFFVALAVPKSDAAWPAIKAALDNEARTAWPQFFGTPPAGLVIGPELPVGCTNPKFANKIIDGDGYDEHGKAYSAKEGYAGHWVIKIASQFAPKVYSWRNNWEETIHTGVVVKCGDYVSVSGSCVSNQSTQSPGMYMNLGIVAFEREGASIVSAASIDPTAAFGTRGNGVPAVTPPPPAVTTPPSGTASPGGDAPPPPHTTYMDPPVPTGPTMTAKAGASTYQSFIDKGWTEAQLREHGYIV